MRHPPVSSTGRLVGRVASLVRSWPGPPRNLITFLPPAMQHDPLTWFFIAALAVVAVFLYKRLPYKEWDTEKDRRRDLAALARKLRMQFRPNMDFDFARRYLFLSWLNRGDNNCASNVIEGEQQGAPVTIFDYSFTAGKATFYWSAYILAACGDLPDLVITKEGGAAGAADAADASSVKLESGGFTHTFRVRSADQQFVSDVCRPRLMEFLRANRDLTLEIRGNAVAILFEDWLHPDQVERNLARIGELRQLLPSYVFGGK